MEFRRAYDACLCGRGERRDWRTVDCGVLERGHSVVGMTTSEARAKNLESQGAEAVILDAFDAPAVEAALRRSKAEAVIDELTSLPKAQSDRPKYAAVDRKLRIEGGGNLCSLTPGELSFGVI